MSDRRHFVFRYGNVVEPYVASEVSGGGGAYSEISGVFRDSRRNRIDFRPVVRAAYSPGVCTSKMFAFFVVPFDADGSSACSALAQCCFHPRSVTVEPSGFHVKVKPCQS